MRQLIPCKACGRHHHATEAACPHCGGAVAKAPGIQLGRNIKMGALLAFTAATTAACYGTPLPYRPMPGPAIEQPSEKIPTASGHAFMFVTPTGGQTGSDNLMMETVKLEGTRLTLASVTVDLSTTIELPSADKLKTGTTLDLKDAKYFYAKVRYFMDKETPNNQKDLIATLPGNDPVTGSLTLTDVTDGYIKGTLKITTSTASVSLYFFCLR